MKQVNEPAHLTPTDAGGGEGGGGQPRELYGRAVRVKTPTTVGGGASRVTLHPEGFTSTFVEKIQVTNGHQIK